MIGETLGHYEIERRIGAGGMGMVYSATDTRLERPVAIKVIHEGLENADLRERFWREAKAAAAIQHPGVCQVYEVGEDAGRLFIVMELLHGQTLEDRLLYGPLDPDEALRIGLALLDTLAAMHRKNLLHRDIKPSNVFLLEDGRSKLLDFGLVRPTRHDTAEPLEATALTRPGLGVGTPGYMSPEQILGEPLDPRSDLFSFGIVLYEALCGERPFKGDNPIEIMNAALKERPVPLRGSGRHEAAGAIALRAMARNREDRYGDAESMASAIRAVRQGTDTNMPLAATRSVARLAVLPFRMLRPDPERDFLGPSIADAITLSLTGIESLVVRSTVASSRFASDTPDLERIGRELDVEVVLFGTLLAAGDRCRATAQLVETPGGGIRWSETVDVSARDIFELQDSLTRKIVDSLQLPLTERERGGLSHDVPASPSGYELFLRANELSSPDGDPPVARDLYVRALENDPHFAPAWGRLANCYRLIGKYYPQNRKQNYERASAALKRAFELRADFPAASLVEAQIDLDQGRTEGALADLLDVVERNSNEVAGFVGLVTALRYAGLLQESVLAFKRVRQLDPEIMTSVEFTYVMLGDFAKARAESREPVMLLAYAAMVEGDRAKGLAVLQGNPQMPRRFGRRAGLTLMVAALKGDLGGLKDLRALFGDFPDPEGHFQGAVFLAVLEQRDEALSWLGNAADGGFFGIADAPMAAFARYREDPLYVDILRRAGERAGAVEQRLGERVRNVLA